MISGPPSTEEKQQALERVLRSRALSRSDQLRSFLRYVCEAEFAGRAQQLNEYVLGVSVLGRPADYSPAEDACVRGRAYELRNKLKSYYGSEAPDDPVRIEIDRGAYVPRFERRQGMEPVDRAARADVPSAHVESRSEIGAELPRRRLSPLSAAAFAGAVLLTSFSLYSLYRGGQQPAVKTTETRGLTPELAALWQPFLESDAPLLISFEIRLFFYAPSTGLVVRDFQTNQLAEVAGSKPLAGFRARMRTRDLRETSDYADFGAVHAVFLLGRLLTPQRRAILLKHSGTLGWEDIWNSNIVFVGKPNLNPTIRYAFKEADFVDDDSGVIRNLRPLPGESAEYRCATTHGSGEKYALISVSPGPQTGRHMMILGGSGSELSWALAECVTNPAHVKEIVSHLRLASGECPPAFQVVIQVTFESNVPVKIRYLTHRVSKPS
jgi:hypothetical protein